LSHVAAKATEAAAPEAAEASTAAAPRIAERPTHAYEATREARSPDWLKCKNPACEAKREAEEDWGW
jgi:hypothetical protein